jgi:DNA-binding transcriptional MerR regulator
VEIVETMTKRMATATHGRPTDGHSMRIGEVASLVGLDPPTIRYYEAEGIVPPVSRTASGYRIYTGADTDRLRFVKQARALGLSLSEIREIVSLRDAGSSPCAYVRRLIKRQIEETARRLDELAVLLGELERLDRLPRDLPTESNRDDVCICHVIECAELSAMTA